MSKSRSHENGLVHVVFVYTVYTVYTGPVVVRLAEKVIYREREHGLHAERSSRVIKLLTFTHARTHGPSPRPPRHGLNIVICPINRSPPLQ